MGPGSQFNVSYRTSSSTASQAYAVVRSRQPNGIGGQELFRAYTPNAEETCARWLESNIGAWWRNTGDYQIIAVLNKEADEMAGSQLEKSAQEAGQELGAALAAVITAVSTGQQPPMNSLMALAKTFCSQQGYQGAEAVIAYVQGFGAGFQDGAKSSVVGQLTAGE